MTTTSSSPSQKAAPDVVFQYCTSRALPLLADLELKITRPEEFNDPFEFSPTIVGSITSEELAARLTDQDWLSQHPSVRHLLPPDFEKWDRATLNKHCDSLAPRLDSRFRNMMDYHLSTVSRDFGVLCMSRTPENIAMWAHYADKHRGFVVGFRPDLGLEGSFFKDVDYDASRAEVPALSLLDLLDQPTKGREFARRVLFRKFKDAWEHEQEMRSLFPLAHPNAPFPLILKLIDGRPAYFLPIPSMAITHVIFGKRCSADLEFTIRSLVDKRMLNVQLLRVELKPVGYAIEFQDA